MLKKIMLVFNSKHRYAYLSILVCTVCGRGRTRCMVTIAIVTRPHLCSKSSEMNSVLNDVKSFIPVEKHTITSFASWCCGKAYMVVLLFLAFAVTAKQGWQIRSLMYILIQKVYSSSRCKIKF